MTFLSIKIVCNMTDDHFPFSLIEEYKQISCSHFINLNVLVLNKINYIYFFCFQEKNE
jgi:hypothetical protein